MRNKAKGAILAVAGGIGTVWILLNFTPWVPWAVLFVTCAVICADRAATLVTEVQADRELKKVREKCALPEFLNLDEED